ncbi:MAG: hypothetical protein KKE77_05495 [Alphaproteobacteria bacterium]|jgi:hypothetical protein|nr:hypothetical protein [Alphaproteobacteria bacterium]MBU1757245.1 hypothetical protein [Alphaproteobacteria bacterium]MBU2032250.1 hypothetical protein [Alphaproteobacteria bacterium]MBU2340680.1 hypothetical protein [Alphaproteobacteria bacterium]
MLDLFRLAGPAKLQPANDVIDFPPRAAGHQIRWSVERVIQLLCRAGRRPLDVSAPCSGRRTAQERLLDSMMQAIARGEEGEALGFAEWLVAKREAPRLVRWSEPIARHWELAA